MEVGLCMKHIASDLFVLIATRHFLRHSGAGALDHHITDHGAVVIYSVISKKR